MPKINLDLYYHARRASEELKRREGFSEVISHLDAAADAIAKDVMNNNITKNEVKSKRSKSNFNPKNCEKCNETFKPTGSRQKWCEKCEKPWEEKQKLIRDLMENKGGYNA